MNIELTIKGDIEVLHLEPGDKLVVTLTEHTAEHFAEAVAQIKEHLEQKFPDNEVLIVGGDIRLSRLVTA